MQVPNLQPPQIPDITFAASGSFWALSLSRVPNDTYQLHVPQLCQHEPVQEKPVALELYLNLCQCMLLVVFNTNNLWIHKRCWLYVVLRQNVSTTQNGLHKITELIFSEVLHPIIFVHTFPLYLVFHWLSYEGFLPRDLQKCFFIGIKRDAKNNFKSCFSLLMSNCYLTFSGWSASSDRRLLRGTGIPLVHRQDRLCFSQESGALLVCLGWSDLKKLARLHLRFLTKLRNFSWVH